MSKTSLMTFLEITIWISISLNIEANSINIFCLFRVNFASSVSNRVNIFVNYNTKVNSIKFSCSFCVNDFSFNDNINLFYNIVTLTAIWFLVTRFFYNRIVSKNHSQNFYYLNNEKFQSHKLQELALNELVLNSVFSLSLIFLNYSDQTVSLSYRNCFLNNVFTA